MEVEEHMFMSIIPSSAYRLETASTLEQKSVNSHEEGKKELIILDLSVHFLSLLRRCSSLCEGVLVYSPDKHRLPRHRCR
mmetsp:Transcript_3164/g.4803  ORF Transcript_3164/g.4803 Transcript_3164/m.4803 type:complete len:80 (-) Transcript_3164:245-484(-)